MKKQHHLSLFIVFSMIMVFLVLNTQMEAKAKTPTYIITPSSKPYNVTYSKYSTYNQHTKHYYVLRSYLERWDCQYFCVNDFSTFQGRWPLLYSNRLVRSFDLDI